jgi:hypothetical protein
MTICRCDTSTFGLRAAPARSRIRLVWLQGIADREDYIPMILLRVEDYERGEPGFELAIFVNFAGMMASAAVALAIGLGSL